MLVSDILQIKGTEVHSIAPSATLTAAARAMMDRRCGALVVLDQGRLVGIISERDLLRLAATGESLDSVFVGECMTRHVFTGRPDDEVKDVMGVLTNRRIRHLPIVHEGNLAGLISIGDVVKCQYDALAFENQVLKDYIQG